tara:strand:- start:142 stop:1203 length:1062 start_codon:yes stop_codon:yes gene_type:complete
MNLKFWKNRNVFITGHTGFKGGWISLWLSKLGANVYGYSLPPPTQINFFKSIKLEKLLSKSTIENILDLKTLINAMKTANPSVIIHMAAQPLVRESYSSPIETFKTNVIGTANVLEAARYTENVKAIINVTTDKCYENLEQISPYQENDRLGGYDPYSSSKACAELVSTAYRKSFFNKCGINLATVRGGNVIGGGDWARDRLIPDFFRALNAGKSLQIRSPNAIRPWQHVLEPISGYLMLAEKLVIDGNNYAEAWNFGPDESKARSVSQIIKHLSSSFKGSSWNIENTPQLHEAGLLKIDSSKAKSRLGWIHQWNLETALNKTIDWYQVWCSRGDLMFITNAQIDAYEKKIKK